MMVKVALPASVIHDAADLSQMVTFRSPDVSVAFTVGGQVRSYAAGNRRAVVGPDHSTVLDVAVIAVSQADYAKLLALAGKIVLYRDGWGTATYCFLSEVSKSDDTALQSGLVHNARLRLETVDAP